MRVVLLAVFLCQLGVSAGVGAETARQILDRRKALDDGPRKWTDRTQELALTIRGTRGGERNRRLKLLERRYPGDETKTVMFFLEPAEVKDTAFLAFTHKGRPADQWMYLPELQRVRAITSRARQESFVGTDLSYHDLDLITEMVSWTEEDAVSSLRGVEPIEGVASHVVELAPKREDIGYRKVVLWLGTDDLVPRKLEFFMEASEAHKRLLQSDIRNVGAIPVAHTIRVETPGAGSNTEIRVSGAGFDQGLEDALFTQDALERGAP